MATSLHVYKYDGMKSFHLSKWKIRVGHQLYYNSTILSYKQNEGVKSDITEPLLKYKSNIGGTVTELLVSEGDIVESGMPLLKVKPCSHPVIMKDLCAECGTDLRNLDRDNFENVTAAATFSMVHVVPELKVSYEQAEKLSQDDEDRLLKNEKLVLLVDLDQTLIHTTNDNIPETMEVDAHFQLYGQHSPWYHTKLRPGTQSFLEKISRFYELHICTFGARLYAHRIAQILDPKGKYFSHRILSRDECFDPTSKTANLKALFPKGDHMVCIIDDREDVWNFAPNVIRVKPYTFFRNTGDINAPPIPLDPKEASSPNLNETNAVLVEKSVKPDPTEASSANLNETNAVLVEKSVKPDPTEASSTNLNETNAVLVEKSVKSEEANVSSDNKPVTSKETSETNDSGLKETNNSESISNKIENPETSCDKESSAETLKEVKEVVLAETQDSKENSCAENKKDDIAQKENSSNIQKDNNVPSATNVNNCDSNSEKKTDGGEGKEETPLNIVETDDYLLYLEEILISVHKSYYNLYKKRKEIKDNSIPDLKKVVPDVRKKILRKVNIVFSSIVPTNCDAERHHFWLLAESLGATVSRNLVLDSSHKRTTHLIALKSNTSKVNTARQHKDIWVLTLDWLLCCEERWERADERLFILPKDATESENSEILLRKHNRLKRPFSSEKKQGKSEEDKFSERVFAEAGLALSQDEIDDMDREIEQACSEESEDSQDSKASSESSSSVESLSSGDYPKGWKRRRKCDAIDEQIMLNAVNSESSDVDTIGSVDEEMAEAVKREFQDF
ncbi:RNA polymerase II subunit A C-terminal domain phosphatase [Parasteatoda tepidariorum]|uniref:RNA polymerase II subunit A C-terminal domain phosphatase n=1 Tax=Parasteatoda tepidariorum TaxID=114398 RepID=UPI00077FB264|nr:RNA polymerase II subunit A C-terminal domain phosphatase [Parasteatoda tepidariorum]